MTLLVHAAGHYRSDIATPWREHDWAVHHLVKSLKGQSYNGYAYFPFGGVNYKLTAKNPSNSYTAWTQWAARRLREMNLGKVVLVPVPSSSQTQYAQKTGPVQMANELAKLVPTLAVVGNHLKHTRVVPKAHSENGTRDAERIARTLESNIPKTSALVVLIDDVMTSGGHLRACARVLRDRGAKVEHALVAARTIQHGNADPLKVPIVDLEDFDF